MKFKIIDNSSKTINEDDFPIHYDDISETFLDDNVFNYVRFIRNKFRYSHASTKSRSQIVTTGAKHHKQKGTGSARRGVNSSPVVRGGAVAHGPQPRSFSTKLNKKLIHKLRYLSFKRVSDQISVFSEDFNIQRTKEASNLFLSLGIQNKRILIITDDSIEDNHLLKAFRNISYVKIIDIKYIDPELLFISDQIFMTYKSYSTFKGYYND